MDKIDAAMPGRTLALSSGQAGCKPISENEQASTDKSRQRNRVGADITETDHPGRNSAQHLLQEATQEEMGIEGETEGKTNNIRKRKNRVHPALQLAQNRHRNLCAQWFLARFPRNPIVTVQELGEVGSVVRKNGKGKY